MYSEIANRYLINTCKCSVTIKPNALIIEFILIGFGSCAISTQIHLNSSIANQTQSNVWYNQTFMQSNTIKVHQFDRDLLVLLNVDQLTTPGIHTQFQQVSKLHVVWS